MYYCMKSYVCLIYLIHLECMIAYSTWNVIILENILYKEYIWSYEEYSKV